MFDVTALGEILIDFTQIDISESGSPIFQANPGGAPCNMLCALSNLEKSTQFIGKVGNDMFGEMLKNTLEAHNVNIDNLKFSDDEFTTLAFVKIDKNANRSFSFSRKNSADIMLCAEEVDKKAILNSKIFHCGTLSLTHEKSKKATLKALNIAKENGVVISVDPNLRLNLWKNNEDAKNAMTTVFEFADIIKISDNEVEFYTDSEDILKGAKIIFEKFKPKMIFLTCGKNGAYIITKNETIYASANENIKAIDTTGAGDCFCAAAISKLLDKNLNFDALTKESLKEILVFSNTVAGISTTKLGAIPSYPKIEELNK